jgi:hypothetical protein
MIVQLQHRKHRKDLKELESIWQKLNDLRVAFYYLKTHEQAIYEAKQSLEKSDDDKRLTKVVDALDDLEELVDLESFDEMEKSTASVLMEIDEGFFDGKLYEKFMEEDDED